MLELFKGIKSVGFDLDDTLYPPSQEIDDRIRAEIAQKILHKKSELMDIESAKCFYQEERKRIGSGTQVLENIGYKNAKEIMRKCLIEADVSDLLKKDLKLVELMETLRNKYELFLITASPKDLAIKKLRKIRINPSSFNHSIFGDTPNVGKKIDASIFKYFLNQSDYFPEQHVYVGDSLKADIIPTKSLGMRTISVGGNIPEADFSIEKIHDLENLLL